MALVIVSNYGFHGVLVDAGTGKVLASTDMSFAGGSMVMMMGAGMHQGMITHYPGMMGRLHL
jgi:hypothetical protein